MARKNARKKRAEVPKQERPEEAQEPPRESRLRAYLFKWIEPDGVTAFFTFVLAVFAIAAWREATKGTVAMQGQLKAMLADQEPIVMVTMAEGPHFDSADSRIAWNVVYLNTGRGIAFDFRPQTFMRSMRDEFEPNGASTGPYVDIDHQAVTTTLLPREAKSIQVWSTPGITDAHFQILTMASAVSVLVHVKYKTASDGGTTTERWFCFNKLVDGTTLEPPVASCLSQLPRKYGGTKD